MYAGDLQINNLNSEVTQLRTKNEVLHQVVNQQNLFFSGIEESAIENPDNLPAKMTTFNKEKLNVRVVIDTSFRIEPKSDN
ncbi:unnamed protein product [Orchesella dallaii]|uniref:Uncharacterized protein n=1 Tax=Orchesella dallaii TaxID=48710 RepID=A0ABP1S1I2_9HEXA